MYNLSPQEVEWLTDALNMALASNKRMQASKPKFKNIFDQIEKDLNGLKIKLQTPVEPTNTKNK